MITLAIDPSTKSTGVAIFTDKNLTHYECITSENSNIYFRIDKMVEELERIINQFCPTHVIIESVQPEDVHNNNTVFRSLVYLQGFIMHLLNKKNIPSANIKFYTASEWRKKCGIHTGRGVHRETLKQEDKAFVRNQFNLSVNDDIADAICIGFAAVGGVVKKREVIVDDSGFEFA